MGQFVHRYQTLALQVVDGVLDKIYSLIPRSGILGYIDHSAGLRLKDIS